MVELSPDRFISLKISIGIKTIPGHINYAVIIAHLILEAQPQLDVRNEIWNFFFFTMMASIILPRVSEFFLSQ